MQREGLACMVLTLMWCNGVCVPASDAPVPKTFTNEKDGSVMIPVPAGTFKMGGKEELEGGMVHDVHVEAFYISKFEITNKQFKRFIDANPAWAKPTFVEKGFIFKKKSQTSGIRPDLADSSYLMHWEGNSYPSHEADHPVVNVSWLAAKAYCEWASSGDLHGRLSTEAEWEKACRAGSTGKYCFGDDESKLEDYAWYRDNSDGSTHAVGQKRANEWGIHDMHGNVWEWTSSIQKAYPYKANDGREDHNGTGSRRVVRGGGWYWGTYVAHYCRSAARGGDGAAPSFCWAYYGFRLVLSARAPK